MRRARPSSWISGASFLPPAGYSESGAGATGAADEDAEANPRERELRAALGSDEVLPNNVTLLMSRRQRGEESDAEEEDEELELEDVVVDDEEAGPGSAGDDGEAAIAAGSTAAQQHNGGGGAIAPLIHQVLRRPLTWRVSLQMNARLVGVHVFPAG